MKNSLVLLLMGFLLSCTSLHYGNFTQASPDVFELMANDTAAQISHVYPPAKNKFCLFQNASDPFGMRLIERLRKKGFGIMEHAHSSRDANFFYVVDEPAQHLYRVSVFIDGQLLSRAYGIEKEGLIPISAWSRKES